MAAEKQFENKIKVFLNTLPNTWYFKHWAGPYSKVGIPDIIACVNGRFVGIEVKAANGHPSELQKRTVRLIQQANGIAYILYPKDFKNFKKDMNDLIKEVN
jgi:uncharacterized membrane-anchored protein